MMPFIKGTGIVRAESGQVTIQDRAQSGENFGNLNAAPLDRGLTFCDIVPARLIGGKEADPRSFFPFSVASA